MTAPVLPPTPESLARAGALLRDGGLVVFPTETVYGLGANALDPGAVARIFAAKGRPATNPLIVHISGIEGVAGVAGGWPPLAEALARAFWPGPLTLVLPRGVGVPDAVTAGGPTVAVRVPAHPVALALLRSAGVPVAAPSANRSNRLSPTLAAHALADLGDAVELILDGGPTPGGIESTVVDVTGPVARLLRPGLISPAELEAVVGEVLRGGRAVVEGPALPSPGMLARHYAPRTPLELASDDGARRVADLAAGGLRVGWLTFGAAAPPLPSGSRTPLAGPGGEGEPGGDAVTLEALPADPAGFAAGLFAALHRLDAAGLDRIVVGRLPEDDAWLGVADRLRRAAQT